MNLSFEVTEGLKKHQSPWDQPQEFISFLSLEAQVVNLADQISYNNHDIDDGLCSSLIGYDSLQKHVVLWKEANDYVDSKHSNLDLETKRSLCISYLISEQISDVLKFSKKQLMEHNICSLDDVKQAKTPLVGFSAEMEEKTAQLRKYLYEEFYTHPKVYRMNKKGQHIIKALFDHFVIDTKLLPKIVQKQLEKEGDVYRVVADYVSGMTDPYAEKVYYSLF